ncbi:MAG: hypothetical protein D6730_02845 [Bacteroidetes bacterium]|nr:MAG: hypothetical protein D6730_02845 [Bacteroidota bacterium]
MVNFKFVILLKVKSSLPITWPARLALLLACLPLWLLAQPKYEREYRVGSQQLPVEARQFVATTFGSTRVKWYKEENLSGYTYEAKLRWHRKKYSVEFDSTGQLQDIELLIKARQLPAATRHQIETYLQKAYDKAKITRLQQQWSGPAACLSAAIREEEVSCAYTIHYEVEAFTQQAGKRVPYELLFDEGGKLLSRREIIDAPNTNLVY